MGVRAVCAQEPDTGSALAMLVAGGRVAEFVAGDATLQVGGGHVSYASLSGNSFGSLHAGEVERLDLFELADVTLAGGRVVDSIYVQDQANLTLNGAEVTTELVASQTATIVIDGGSAAQLRLFDHSAATLRGGSVDQIALDELVPDRQSASVTVVGSEFNHPPGLLPAAAVFIGADTALGPFYLAYGHAFDASLNTVYFYLGRFY